MHAVFGLRTLFVLGSIAEKDNATATLLMLGLLDIPANTTHLLGL
jgi:hypothetical protein